MLGSSKKLALLALGSCLVAAGLAPVTPSTSAAAPVEGSVRVVVRLKTGQADRATSETRALRAAHRLAVEQRYSHVFQGFSATVPRSEVAALRRDPDVAAVHPDGVVHVAAQRTPAGVTRIQADDHLRLDTRAVTTRGDIAVIDTGVAPHPDLNLYRSVNCARDEGCSTSSPAPDGYGHGTYVAGVAAAKDNDLGVVGVAPGARIWNVRVFDDDGYALTSWVVAALDWVAARADSIEVANASLQGYADDGLTAAVEGATRKGVVVVASAGNDSWDASQTFPASIPAAITVSAFIDTDGRPGGRGEPCETDPGVYQRDDTFLDWSNFGPRVDVAAPGGCVRSTAPDGGYGSLTGTSLSAPHVAGAALLWIDKTHLRAGPQRAAKVSAALRGPWSVSQQSRCGFLGGPSAEPVLLLRGCRR